MAAPPWVVWDMVSDVCLSERPSALSGTRDDYGGHAIEVRLYAEDPAADHAPQSGTLTRFEIPEEPGIRVDAGYASGSVVSTHYDAMLAKVICHAPTRELAARQLAGVLARARIHGVTTNRDQLVAVLRDPAFLAGEVTTAFLETRPACRPTPDRGAHVAAAIALAEADRAARTVQQGIPVAWRNVVSQPQRTEFDEGAGVEWWGGRDGYVVDGAAVVSASPGRVVLEQDGVATAYDVAVAGDTVDVDSARGHARLQPVPRFTDLADAVASGSLLAPMPGTVVSLAVAKGDDVAAGQPVLVLEAMKMQHTVAAPTAGTVTEIDVEPGAQVAAGEVLAVVSASTQQDETDERVVDAHVHRVRGAPGVAPSGRQARLEVRPRVVHREGAVGREDDRALARDRPQRLPRDRHPRGVRRRGRRHR
jgi:propionyl-CoA carboxylase alpha chain